MLTFASPEAREISRRTRSKWWCVLREEFYPMFFGFDRWYFIGDIDHSRQ
jgi:hypothetical protein